MDLHPAQIFAMEEIDAFGSDAGAYYSGIVAARSLLDRREIHLRKMLFNLRLAVTEGPLSMAYQEEYCFRDAELAWKAFETWDGNGDPVGWFKHANRNRYAVNLDGIRWTIP